MLQWSWEEEVLAAHWRKFREENIDPLLWNLRESGDSQLESSAAVQAPLQSIKEAVLAAKKWEIQLTDQIALMTRETDERIRSNQLSSLPDLVSSRLQLIAAQFPTCFEPPAAGAASSLPVKPKPNQGWKRFTENTEWAEDDPRWEEDIEVKAHIDTSFRSLEPQLRECLVRLSVFPENAIIKKRCLIYWWIGEDVVKPTSSESAEEVGERCFHLLLATGMVEPITDRYTRSIKRCRLHPLVSQVLAQQLRVPPHCLVSTRTGDEGLCQLIPVVGDDFSDGYEGQIHRGHFRLGNPSIINLSARRLYLPRNKNMTRLKKVPVLQLGRWQDWPDHHIEIEDAQFLTSLGVLKSLKYLSLRGISLIKEIPDSVGELPHLLILDLQSCHNLERLTPKITMLSKLTHLDVSECSLLELMPPGLDSLTSLQVLKGFALRTSSNHRGRLGELAELPSLWKLSINLGFYTQKVEDLHDLSKLRRLRSLTIVWGREKSSTTLSPPPSKTPKKSLSKLKSQTSIPTTITISAPPSLEKLDLQCMPSNETLNWLKPDQLQSLNKLYIRGGKLKKLPFGGDGFQAWNVQTFRLKFLEELKLEDWALVHTSFPRLECVQVFDCPRVKTHLLLDEHGIWCKNAEETMTSASTSF